MARMKFLCDAGRCIECNGCVTACKNENEVPWGMNRRRVVTINDGEPGERSISVACMHCSDAPCAAVCPVDCFYTTDDGVVLHDKDICIGCGYCFYACPFGAPQFPGVWLKANYHCVPRCVPPRLCLPVMAIKFPIFFGSGSLIAALVSVPGVGVSPIKVNNQLALNSFMTQYFNTRYSVMEYR